MALQVCRDCGGQVSSDAKKCPACGKPTPPKLLDWVWIALFTLALAVAASCLISPPWTHH